MSRALHHTERMLTEAAASKLAALAGGASGRWRVQRLLLDAILLLDAGSSTHALAFIGQALRSRIETPGALPLPSEVADTLLGLKRALSDGDGLPLRPAAAALMDAAVSRTLPNEAAGVAVEALSGTLMASRTPSCRTHSGWSAS